MVAPWRRSTLSYVPSVLAAHTSFKQDVKPTITILSAREQSCQGLSHAAACGEPSAVESISEEPWPGVGAAGGGVLTAGSAG